MVDEGYAADLQNLYRAKNESDIYAVLDFCEKYYGKLGLGQIPDLMKMFNENTEASPAQNEYIVELLDKIVEKYGQEAVNIIVERSDSLLEEDSEGCMPYLIIMFFFWHADRQFDIVTPLRTAKDHIKKLYQKWVHEKIDYMQKHSEYYKPEQVKRIQHIEEQLSEL
ncbi:MAG: hypothetical protein K1W08_01185 [Lachnospiraceae bacterium]